MTKKHDINKIVEDQFNDPAWVAGAAKYLQYDHRLVGLYKRVGLPKDYNVANERKKMADGAAAEIAQIKRLNPRMTEHDLEAYRDGWLDPAEIAAKCAKSVEEFERAMGKPLTSADFEILSMNKAPKEAK
jgi:hypothetical protein